jgi:hypothetical protein
LIQAKCGVLAAFQKLDYSARVLDDQNTLDQSGITNEAVVGLSTNLRKPMIYLFGRGYVTSRGYTSVGYLVFQGMQVQLSLDRAWEFSMMHPSTNTPPGDYVQTAKWTVDLQKDGTLFSCLSQSTRLLRRYPSPLPKHHNTCNDALQGTNNCPNCRRVGQHQTQLQPRTSHLERDSMPGTNLANSYPSTRAVELDGMEVS